MTKQLVIVGNGMATGRLLDELSTKNDLGWSIRVIGEEPQGSYNRIMLSPVLAGEMASESIISKCPNWFESANIQFDAGERVVEIDRSEKRLLTASGKQVSYDHLVIATGSRPARIPAKNQELSGVFSFRTLADVSAIHNILSSHAVDHSRGIRAVVVGGGFLGLEAAYGLAQQGASVTVVHRSGWLLNRQLDRRAAEYLQRVMENKNITFQLSDEVVQFCGSDGQLTGAELRGGRRLDCDLAVIATGITPNKELGSEAGLVCERGINVDGLMRTSDDAISAIGECVEHEGETFGLVEPIWEHCKVLANRLSDQYCEPFAQSAIATKLKVSGVQLYSAGLPHSSDELNELIYDDPKQGIYRKLLLNKQDQIVGVVLFGDVNSGADYFDMMSRGDCVRDVAETLIFGKAFFESAA